jgi:hypothetical protein
MNDFWKNYYSQLEGAVILRFEGLADGEFPAFTVKLKDGKFAVMEISQDPEGNGGGFIFGLPTPKAVEA